jgi:type IV pilus assembly protein PilX
LRRQQSGAVLIVSLIFLLVMTALGVTSVQVTSLEEKMVGNTRERSVAFQAAESALKEGESLIENPVTLAALTFPTTVGGTSTQAGIYRSDSAAPSLSTCASPCSLQKAYLLDEFWTNSVNYRTYMDTNNDGVADVDKNGDGTPDVNAFGVANTPKYVIEKLTEAPAPPLTGSYYRITAWGVGGTADSVVIVQSTYLK